MMLVGGYSSLMSDIKGESGAGLLLVLMSCSLAGTTLEGVVRKEKGREEKGRWVGVLGRREIQVQPTLPSGSKEVDASNPKCAKQRTLPIPVCFLSSRSRRRVPLLTPPRRTQPNGLCQRMISTSDTSSPVRQTLLIPWPVPDPHRGPPILRKGKR